LERKRKKERENEDKWAKINAKSNFWQSGREWRNLLFGMCLKITIV
jgi:hypothetical protein